MLALPWSSFSTTALLFQLQPQSSGRCWSLVLSFASFIYASGHRFLFLSGKPSRKPLLPAGLQMTWPPKHLTLPPPIYRSCQETEHGWSAADCDLFNDLQEPNYISVTATEHQRNSPNKADSLFFLKLQFARNCTFSYTDLRVDFMEMAWQERPGWG